MKVINNPQALSKALKQYKLKNKTIGLVPTMGALHQGHLSLIRGARRDNECVVVSIFVNPTQFGPKEDLKSYPRPVSKDLSLCRDEGVDIVFNPSVQVMYPEDFCTYIEVGGLSNLLCGKSRPKHFRGVATVVAKIFNIVQPDVVYFGQKDAQQAVIVKKMAEDLNFPLEAKVMPTVREESGLALSSRNVYLSKPEKEEALVLSESLRLARGLIKGGNNDAREIINFIRNMIKAKRDAKIDYIAIVDSESLQPVKKIKNQTLIALAVYIGKTRLIDNIIIN